MAYETLKRRAVKLAEAKRQLEIEKDKLAMDIGKMMALRLIDLIDLRNEETTHNSTSFLSSDNFDEDSVLKEMFHLVMWLSLSEYVVATALNERLRRRGHTVGVNNQLGAAGKLRLTFQPAP